MTILDDKTDLDDAVTRPSYYGGPDNPFEPVKVIHTVGLGPGFYYGSSLKYLQRTGKKEGQAEADLRKAHWYLGNGAKLGYQVPQLHADANAATRVGFTLWARSVAEGWGMDPNTGLGNVVYLLLTGRVEEADARLAALREGTP